VKHKPNLNFFMCLNVIRGADRAHYYLTQIHRVKGEFTLAAREVEDAITYAPWDARQLAILGQLQTEQHHLAATHTSRYHDEESKKGIVGLVRKGERDYPGFMPSN